MDITSYLLGKQAGGGGGDVSLQTNKSVTITSNGSTTVNPDEGYDAMKKVTVTTNVPTGADLNEYFNNTITENSSNIHIGQQLCKKFPSEIYIANNVTNLQYLFQDFRNLEEFPKIICNSNVTVFYGMYNTGSSHTYTKNIDLSGLNTSNATTMAGMFQKIFGLTTLGLSNFNTQKVTNMSQMFMNNGFQTLDLSSFQTPALTNTSQMFAFDTTLTNIDLRNFDFTNVATYSDMFGSNASYGVPDNCLIIVKDDTAKTWITSKFSRLTNVKTVAEL